MPIELHLLQRPRRTYSRGALLKDAVTGHLLRQLLVRQFSVSGGWGYKYANYTTESTTDEHSYPKSHGLAALRANYDAGGVSGPAPRNPNAAFGSWGNVLNSGRYYGRWDATVISRRYAVTTVAQGRNDGLTHLASVDVTVTGFSVPTGAGQPRIAWQVSSSSSPASAMGTVSMLQSLPFVEVSGNGSISLPLHVAAPAYVHLIAYFANLEPPDEDGYSFNWQIMDYATAQFNIALNATFTFETEEEAGLAAGE